MSGYRVAKGNKKTIKKRPLWTIWFEWLFIIVGVIGLSPFILTAFFSVACFVFEDNNSCHVLSSFQHIKPIDISDKK